MTDETRDYYQPHYSFHARRALWDALRARFERPTNPAVESGLLPADVSPLPITAMDPMEDLREQMFECIRGLHQRLGVILHTATGLDLGDLLGAPLPPNPGHGDLLRVVGGRVGQVVRSAIIDNAWHILRYGDVRTSLGKDAPGGPCRANDPGEDVTGEVVREFHLGAFPAEVEERYRLPDLDEPLRQFGEYLDDLRRQHGAEARVRRIPTLIYPRPYPEAVSILLENGKEAELLADELPHRITDIFCTAARMDLGLPPQGQGVDRLLAWLRSTGQGVAILLRRVLSVVPRLTGFTSMAAVKAMLSPHTDPGLSRGRTVTR